MSAPRHDGEVAPEPVERPGTSVARVGAGLVIIVAGLALLSDRLGIAGVELSGRYWPLLLVMFGLVRLAAPPLRRDGGRRSRRTGAWFIYLGLWGMVTEFHLLGFSYHTSWPLLIVGAGVWMIWRALDGQPGGSGQPMRER